MLVPMTKVRILGRRREVERVVDELQRLGLVEIADARAAEAVDELGGEEARSARREELRLLAARIDALLGRSRPTPERRPRGTAGSARRWMPARLRAELDRLSPRVEALRPAAGRAPRRAAGPARRTSSRSGGCCRSCPSSRTSTTSSSGACGWTPSRSSSTPTTSRSSRRCATQLAEELGDRFELVWTRVDDGGDRLPGRVPARATERAVQRPARARAGSPGRAARGVRAPLAARGRRGDASAAWRSSRRPIAAVRARARGAAAPARRAARASCARRSPTSSSGSTRSSGSARRSARSSPSAGCRGAQLARLRARARLAPRRRRPRRGPGDLSARPAGAAADAQFARWPGRSSRSCASSSFRAPARSIRRC